MNFFFKQRIWFFIALFFMVLTVTLLIGMWHNKHSHRNHNRGKDNFRNHVDREHPKEFSLTDYLAKELNLNSAQKNKLDTLNKLIDTKKDSLWEQNEISKSLFNKELYAYISNKNRQDSLIICMNDFTGQFNKTRIEHIEKIKAICTDEQKKKLPDALNNLKGIEFKRRHHNQYCNHH